MTLQTEPSLSGVPCTAPDKLPGAETPPMSGSGGSFWTPEREDLLTDMWNVKEMTPRQISEILGCGRNAVIGKAHRLRLNKRENPVKQYLSAEERHAKKLEKARKKAAKAEEIRKNEERLRNGGVLLEDLTILTCRFPIGDPGEPGFHFCGRHSSIDRAYCDEHHAKCHKRSNDQT